jgi:hypothetical protein
MRNNWLMAVALVFLMGAPAFAQSGAVDDTQQPPYARKREVLQERIEQAQLQKMTEVLNLDEATAQKLAPLIKEHTERQRQLRVKRINLVDQLRGELAKESADPAFLRKTLGEFKQNELDIVQGRNNQLDEFSKILSDEQMAKLVVFVPQFERDVKRAMRDVRARRQQGNMMPGPNFPQNCPLGNEPMRGGLDMPPPPPADMAPIE